MHSEHCTERIHAYVRSHFGSSRDPSSRLEFPLHLPPRQHHQDSFRVRFLFAVYMAWPLLLLALSSFWGNLVVLDLVRHLWWNMGLQLGRSQPRAGLARPNVTLSDFLPAKRERKKGNRGTSLPLCLANQMWSLGANHHASNQKRTVKMQSLEDGTETHQQEDQGKRQIAQNSHVHARGTQDESCLVGSQKAIPTLAKSDRQAEKLSGASLEEIEFETEEASGNPAKMDRG